MDRSHGKPRAKRAHRVTVVAAGERCDPGCDQWQAAWMLEMRHHALLAHDHGYVWREAVLGEQRQQLQRGRRLHSGRRDRTVGPVAATQGRASSVTRASAGELIGAAGPAPASSEARHVAVASSSMELASISTPKSTRLWTRPGVSSSAWSSINRCKASATGCPSKQCNTWIKSDGSSIGS